jgi:hypothetical protein
MHYCPENCTGGILCKQQAIKFIEDIYPTSEPHLKVKLFLQAAINRENAISKKEFDKYETEMMIHFTTFKIQFQSQELENTMLQEILKFIS